MRCLITLSRGEKNSKMLVSKLVNSITPYKAGEQPQDMEYIKINTNENPYPPSEKVRAVLDGEKIEKLRLYPDPNCTILTKKIAQTYNVLEENVFLGNGSDEVLAFCFPAFFDQNDLPVAYADITYSFYKVWAKMFNINSKVIPLDENFAINKNDYINLDCKGIIITNPNAPTGMMLKKDELIEIIKSNKDKIVIVDEAYVDFANYSMIEETKNYDNLLVVRTFSKSFSLAGIRCGFAVGNKQLIQALNTIKNSINSYTLSRLTQTIATCALEDIDYYIKNAEEIKKTRQFTKEELEKIGFFVLDSQSNFIFAKKEGLSGEDIYKKLKSNGVLVRHFKQDRIEDFIRITISSKEDMIKFIKILQKILK